MKAILTWLAWKLPVLVCTLAVALICGAQVHAADLCDQYRATLVREAQAVHGLGAPVPLFIGQLRQESSCRADVTAKDDGRGLAQFMDGTATQVAKMYPELGTPQPYAPRWAIRALVRYDAWLYQRVQGNTECDRWAATLKAYNAGLGYVQRAQRRSTQPGVWFGATEDINAGQSEQNFTYSRRYPRVVLFTHQPLYTSWGQTVCLGRAA